MKYTCEDFMLRALAEDASSIDDKSTVGEIGNAISTPTDIDSQNRNFSDTLSRKRRKLSIMTKELSAEQKAMVKMHVSREASTEGFVKCNHCEKEITSKNVDRWASHLRGCVKTPEDLKLQIQPFRNVVSPHSSMIAAVAMNAPGVSQTPLQHTPPGNHMHNLQSAITSGYNEVFKVHVSKDYMKFHAAHFIAYKGFREKLHGHNYQVAVTLTGVVGPDGYVVDFSEIKKISRVISKELDESFLVPMNSDALKISFDGTNVHILTEDNSKFSFPKSDCSLLPIVHSSAEELAIYFSNQLIDAFTLVSLLQRGVKKIEVSISEANKQMASYERNILN